jgi:very-short-patch-repair endonuclease
VRLYRRDLDQPLVGEEWALPSTVQSQTLLDCVASMRAPEAELLIDTRLKDGLDRAELRLLLASARRIGNPELRRQLRLGATRWMSEPERRLARAFHERNFPIGMNLPIGPYWGDFVDERARLVAEVDGREPHSQREVFNRDRIRQNWLVDHGWHVRRYAAEIVLRNAGTVADDIIAAIRRRRRSRRK